MQKTNRQKAESYVSKLSPLKLQLGLAILGGSMPHKAAEKLAKRNKQSISTYKAYATMVANGIDKATGGHLKGVGAGKRAAITREKNKRRI